MCVNSQKYKANDMSPTEVKQRCLNLSNDLERHQWMIRFHAIDGLLFLIRFVILCSDLAAASNVDAALQPTIKAFLAFILLFELLGGLSVLLANILYSCMIYAGRILYETDNDDIPYCPRKPLLRLSTFTCFTCHCYYERPKAVLHTRMVILSVFLFLRLIGFILGATCANHYPPRAIAYTVFAALSFVPSMVTMMLEYRHQHRLWNYFPDGDTSKDRSQKHLQFLPYSIINDQRTSSWRSSSCKQSESCQSQNLYHILLHHSGSTQYGKGTEKIIGFHQTEESAALGISQTGFNSSEDGMLGPGVYFATCIEHTEFKANRKGAYICAKIKPGEIKETTSRNKRKNALLQCDTVYFRHKHKSDEFCVRDPERIEEWIIVINQDSTEQAADDKELKVVDRFHGETYTGCIY